MTCQYDGVSQEHTHDFDEYMVVVDGEYTLVLRDQRITLTSGQEYYYQQKCLTPASSGPGPGQFMPLAGNEQRELNQSLSTLQVEIPKAALTGQ